MPSPANDIATQLATSSGGALTVGTNLFVGPSRPVGGLIPSKAVFVLSSGGAAPQPYLGNNGDWRQSMLEIAIRSDVDAFADGETLARDVQRWIHRNPPAGYITVLAEQSEPEYIGRDEQGRHEWTLLAVAWWKS